MPELLPIKARKLLKLHRFILQKLIKCSVQDAKTILHNAPIELIKTLRIIFKLLAEDKLGKAPKNITNKRLHKLSLGKLREVLINHPQAPLKRLLQKAVSLIIRS